MELEIGGSRVFPGRVARESERKAEIGVRVVYASMAIRVD